MKRYLSIIILFASLNTAFGQKKSDETKINYITLTDSVLVSTINKILNQEVNSSDTSNLFKKNLGYVSVHITKYAQADTLRSYYVALELLSIKEDSDNSRYPDYYTFVNNRLVIVYLDVIGTFTNRTFSEKAKKQMRRRIDSCLIKTKKVTFYDADGKKSFTDKKFRIDYFNFGGGLNVYIIKGKPPIIKKAEM